MSALRHGSLEETDLGWLKPGDRLHSLTFGIDGTYVGPHARIGIEWTRDDTGKSHFSPFHLLAPAAHPAPEQVAEASGRDGDEEEAYQIGKRDGYEEAVADLDRLTGGDGEYVFRSDGMGCDTVEKMKARIVDRIDILSSQAERGHVMIRQSVLEHAIKWARKDRAFEPAAYLEEAVSRAVATPSAQADRGWNADLSAAPRDGTPFYIRAQSPYRFQPYKKSSDQFRHGIKGRWQTMTKYGGWDNCAEPVGDWKHHPDLSPGVSPERIEGAGEDNPFTFDFVQALSKATFDQKFGLNAWRDTNDDVRRVWINQTQDVIQTARLEADLSARGGA